MVYAENKGMTGICEGKGSLVYAEDGDLGIRGPMSEISFVMMVGNCMKWRIDDDDGSWVMIGTWIDGKGDSNVWSQEFWLRLWQVRYRRLHKIKGRN